jgi:hypothetical protein
MTAQAGRSVGRLRSVRSWAAVAAVVLGILGLTAAVLVIVRNGGTTKATTARQPEPEPRSGPGPGASGRWERLPGWPGSPRTEATATWTGTELLVIGGVIDLCPPQADCFGSMRSSERSDGAALDPATGRWRAVAAAPVPISGTVPVMVRGDLYVLTRSPDAGQGVPAAERKGRTFLRYSVDQDRWTTLRTPPGNTNSYGLVPGGDEVVAAPGSDEGGSQPVLRYDAAADAWRELPDDPLPRLFDRAMAWDGGDLYLFGRELVPNPGSERPSINLAARFEPASSTWERLPDSQLIGTGMLAAGDGILVNPSLGSADGGEIGNWGRDYAEGGILDARRGRWEALPALPASVAHPYSVGILAGDRSWYWQADGVVLDVARHRWVEIPALPGPHDANRQVAAAGPDAVAFGGVDRSDREDPTPFDEVWIWRAPG